MFIVGRFVCHAMSQGKGVRILPERKGLASEKELIDLRSQELLEKLTL